MTEQELDTYLIDHGFVLGSWDELDQLRAKCPAIIRCRYEQHDPRYCKVFLMSVSLRSWYVFIPNYENKEE